MSVTTILHKGLTVHLPAEATLVIGDGDGETTITARRSVIGEAPRLVLPAEPRIIPALGAPIAGGFHAGPWPHDTAKAMVIASRDAETEAEWLKAVEHCRAYRGGGFDDWRAFDRLGGLALFLRLAQCNAEASAFKEGGEQAFAKEAYWTGEEYQFGSDYAWYQYFGLGGSGGWSKYGVLRVRPVRIAPYSAI